MKTKTLFVALLLANIGCFSSSNAVDYAMSRTVDKAADRVGDEIGKAVVASMLANNPQLLYAYSMSVFQFMFYQGGYYFAGSDDFEPGEWARWRVTGYEEANTAERTLLKTNEDGSQWWRVETHSKQKDGGEDVVIMEALFTAPDDTGTRRITRMRTLLPGNAEPNEVPITEQERDRWVVHSGQKLTKESAEGMTIGVEEVKTEAGTFQCQHLQTKSSDGKVTLNWFINADVPGQFVKYTSVNEGKVQSSTELIAYGKDATASKLGTF